MACLAVASTKNTGIIRNISQVHLESTATGCKHWHTGYTQSWSGWARSGRMPLDEFFVVGRANFLTPKSAVKRICHYLMPPWGGGPLYLRCSQVLSRGSTRLEPLFDFYKVQFKICLAHVFDIHNSNCLTCLFLIGFHLLRCISFIKLYFTCKVVTTYSYWVLVFSVCVVSYYILFL